MGCSKEDLDRYTTASRRKTQFDALWQQQTLRGGASSRKKLNKQKREARQVAIHNRLAELQEEPSSIEQDISSLLEPTWIESEKGNTDDGREPDFAELDSDSENDEEAFVGYRELGMNIRWCGCAGGCCYLRSGQEEAEPNSFGLSYESGSNYVEVEDAEGASQPSDECTENFDFVQETKDDLDTDHVCGAPDIQTLISGNEPCDDELQSTEDDVSHLGASIPCGMEGVTETLSDDWTQGIPIGKWSDATEEEEQDNIINLFLENWQEDEVSLRGGVKLRRPLLQVIVEEEESEDDSQTLEKMVNKWKKDGFQPGRFAWQSYNRTLEKSAGRRCHHPTSLGDGTATPGNEVHRGCNEINTDDQPAGGRCHHPLPIRMELRFLARKSKREAQRSTLTINLPEAAAITLFPWGMDLRFPVKIAFKAVGRTVSLWSLLLRRTQSEEVLGQMKSEEVGVLLQLPHANSNIGNFCKSFVGARERQRDRSARPRTRTTWSEN